VAGNKNWIKGAIEHPGALTKKAKRAGDSPMEFAREHMGASGTTGKQSRLAMTLAGLRGGGKKKSAPKKGPRRQADLLEGRM
jgi:hypothetical protein